MNFSSQTLTFTKMLLPTRNKKKSRKEKKNRKSLMNKNFVFKLLLHKNVLALVKKNLLIIENTLIICILIQVLYDSMR